MSSRIKDNTESMAEKSSSRHYYMRCQDCGVKMHLGAFRCWKCGARITSETKVYRSSSYDDAIYSESLCDIDRCMVCPRVQKGENPCNYVICFATGRGKCADCYRYQPVRYSCCQRILKAESVMPQGIRKVV